MPEPWNDPLVWATIALVAITAFYAWQTRATVAEMKRARGQSVLPKLKVSIHPMGAGVGWIRITNVGPGAALNVVVRLQPLPGGDEIVWRTHPLHDEALDRHDGRCCGALHVAYTRT